MVAELCVHYIPIIINISMWQLYLLNVFVTYDTHKAQLPQLILNLLIIIIKAKSSVQVRRCIIPKANKHITAVSVHVRK